MLAHFIAAISNGAYKSFNKLQIVVAYAKLSGVHQLLPHLTTFQASGGKIEVVVGIGQKNTSKEAVEELCAIGADVSIFHYPGALARTFHPKAYILSSDLSGWISVGSSNLTRGGLDTNYEWNTVRRYDLTIAAESAEFKAHGKLFLDLVPANNCSAQTATPALIAELHRRGALPSEFELQNAAMKAAQEAASTPLTDLFGAEQLPDPVSKATKTASNKGSTKGRATRTNKTTGATSKSPGFWKKLSAGDVSTTSSPGQIIIPKAGWAFFPALGTPQITASGAAQADSNMDVIFHDGNGNTLYVTNSRRIHYPPAPGHKRTNEESRFTFRHRIGVFVQLGKDDVLEFRRSTGSGAWFEITRIPKALANIKYGKAHQGLL